MNTDKPILFNLCSSVLLNFKFFAGRDDFHYGLASFALWGRLIVDNLRTDCQSVPPGNARPRPRPSRVWLRPQAALGLSVARHVLVFFRRV